MKDFMNENRVLPDAGKRAIRKAIACLMSVVLVLGMTPAVAFADMSNSLRAGTSPSLGAESASSSDNDAGDGSGSGVDALDSVGDEGDVTAVTFQDSEAASDEGSDDEAEFAIEYDSFVNEAFVGDGRDDGEGAAAVDVEGLNEWSVASDGEKVETLKASAFKPADYGEILERDEAVKAVQEALLARERSVLVAVKDEAGVQGSLARELVESTYVEPSTLSNAGDYLYWHVREWTSSTVYATSGKLYYVKYSLAYNDDAEQEQWMGSAISSLLTELDLNGLGAAEKAASIHDWVATHVKYDFAHESDSSYRAQYSAYGALHDKAAVCQGYATLYYRLCMEAGVPCRLISGTGVVGDDYGSHGWNIVEIDGAWYCVDCTWDSNLSSGKVNVSRTYLLKVGADFEGHVADERFQTDEFASACPLAESSYEIAVSKPEVAVEAEPVNEYGDTAVFTAQAAGFAEEASIAYGWEWSANGEEWEAVPSAYEGAKAQELKVTCTESLKNRQFRCVATASGIDPVYSDSVKFSWKPVEVEVEASLIEGVRSLGDIGKAGRVAEFVAKPSASAKSYQWQQSSDGETWEDVPDTVEGASSDRLSIICTEANVGYSFRCQVETSGRNSTLSDSAQFRFELLAEVEDASVLGYGDAGSFYAAARGDVAESASFSWQCSTDDGVSWASCAEGVEGADTAELLVPFNASTRDFKYRCVLTDEESGLSFTTEAARFDLKESLDIEVSTSPVAGYGQAASFAVSTDADALEGGISSRTWEWSRDENSWSAVPASFAGRDEARLDVPASWVRKGFFYRCTVKAADGRSATSAKAVFEFKDLEANAAMSDVGADKTAIVSATTSLDGTGDLGLTYRWQRSLGGASWVDCDESDYPGAWSRSMQVSYSTEAKDDVFRCTILAPDGRGAVTEAVGFSFPALAVSATASKAARGEEAEFECSVKGVAAAEDDDSDPVFAVSYQWQYFDPENDWSNLDGTEEGDESDKDAVSKLVMDDEVYYTLAFRCVVTTEDGRQAASNVVYIPSPEYAELTLDVTSSEVMLGDTAVLSCTLDRGGSTDLKFALPEGALAKFKWQSTSDGGETWQECAGEGSNTADLKVIATESALNMDYRCEVIDSFGNITVSSPVKVKVDSVVASVSTSEVNLGAQAELKCAVTNGEGKDLTYQWQRSTDAVNWEDISGATNSTYKLAATIANSSYRYRCVVGSETVEAYAESESLALQVSTNCSVSYRAHVQNVGWMPYVKNGVTAGTTGRALCMEAIDIKLDGAPSSAITYRAHVQNIGWQGWAIGEKTAGTTGRSLAMEAVEIKLTGDYAKRFDVYYRVHVSEVGWRGWAKNGATAGSTGQSLPIEAVEVRVVQKGESFNVGGSAVVTKPKLTYQAHVADKGWMSTVNEGATAGTTGQSKRMEALKVNLKDFNGTDNAIWVRSHLSNVGWQSSYVPSGSVSGTTGQSRAMECVVMQLTGAVSKRYDIYYRVHVQDKGWLGWAKNNEWAGTTGGALRIEAIQIKLLLKSDPMKNRGGAAYIPINSTPPNSAISGARVALNVPYYMQTDSRWSGTKIGTKTIGAVGCLVTSVAMKYSFHTGTATYPNTMRNMLSFSGNSLIWSSVARYGYTVTGKYNRRIDNGIMSTIYTQLRAGRPVIIGGAGRKTHYVVVTGYNGSNTSSFNALNFTVNDPSSKSRTTLAAFLSYRPTVLQLIY